MRDSCGQGGYWLACSGASPANSGLVPWPAQPLSLTIPSLPGSLPGGVDLCHSYFGPWSAGAAHYSGARTTPPCPWPYGGLLDPPSPSQFLHKWLLLVWFNIKIPNGWCVVPGSPPHWLGEGGVQPGLGPKPCMTPNHTLFLRSHDKHIGASLLRSDDPLDLLGTCQGPSGGVCASQAPLASFTAALPQPAQLGPSRGRSCPPRRTGDQDLSTTSR